MSNFEAEIFSLSLGWGGILVNRPFSNGLFVNLPPPPSFCLFPPSTGKMHFFWFESRGWQPRVSNPRVNSKTCADPSNLPLCQGTCEYVIWVYLYGCARG